ncbi:DUF3086 domain-containing protein [Calothrix rhizosoleniae]|uniref:DUF3086 domain-containing protein n=1 Tax=Calothrix rhizosoleniae TaxID=888997 RepID=UPI000B49E12D|nr:DUF3086 domain-containing protein [Calothrix rhizosoleniae]
MNTEEYQTPQSGDELSIQSESQQTTPEVKEEEANPSVVNSTIDTTEIDPTQDNAQQVTNNTLEVQEQPSPSQLEQRIAQLQQQKQDLKAEIADLQTTDKTLRAQLHQSQIAMGQMTQEALSQLEQQKQALQISVEQLEKRQERIRNEMKTSFAGVSQDLAIRVQGFKDYLTGSLQDLAVAAEQLQLVPPTKPEPEKTKVKVVQSQESQTEIIQFAPGKFAETTKKIRYLIDQYRTKPDYYGPPWQLRRTFEPVHAERVSNWFFQQGGRGALRTMSSRLQNTLIASAIISILHQMYGNRLRPLVIANSPESLGDWRRGLQDCLGIGRSDFGPDRGVALFERPEAVAQKAERLQKAKQMPLIIIDDSEEQISLSLLQFPLWLAFAPDPRMMRSYDDDF